MNSFLFYLVESSVCLAIFYMVYWFLLRRDTFFLINRMYLLFVSILSMMIPLIPFRMIPGEAIYSAAILLDPVLITPAKIEHYANQHLQWSEIAFLIYITGVIIFLFRFLFQLFQLFFIIRRSGIKNRNDLKVVNVDRGYSPFSFFNFVFINDREIPDDSLETILTHERIHIQQCHTIDLILMETVIILQWFNPFAWFTGRSMKTIHEFLADEGVLREGINKWQYQQMILDETMGIQVNNLTNNFNISLLKKRIIMMTKSRSSFWAKSKLLFTLPAFIAVVLFFSIGSVYEAISINSPESGLKPENPVDQNQQTTKQQTPSNEKDVFKLVDKQPQYPGGEESRQKFMQENIRYPQEALDRGVSGTVFIAFVVEEDGSITNEKILRGIGAGCDEEALRVVKLMPRWKPGLVKDKPVRVQFNLPVKFKLDSKPKQSKPKS